MVSTFHSRLDFERFSQHSRLNDQNQKKRQFAQFLQCIMLLHKGRHLEELRLAFDISGFEPQLIDEWVSFAMTSDSTTTTTTLDLDFWGTGRKLIWYPFCEDNYYCLPQSTLAMQSVEVLRLKCCIFIPSQDMIFMSIKILVLTAVSLPHDNSVPDLIASCPCLEELHLIACIVPQVFIIEDEETKLKCLVFDSCKGASLCLHSFIIHIPSLLRLKFVGRMLSRLYIGDSRLCRFYIGDSRNLIEAEIQLDADHLCCIPTDEEAANARYCAMLREVLSDMDNLESLTISQTFLRVLTFDYDETLQALISGDESNEKLPPPLPNLKHLSLKSFEGRNYTLNLACLLKSS